MYLIFSGYFAAEGLIYPFWPTWLASLGFGASQIGLLIAAAYWPQVIAGVALTYVADWRIDQLRLATLLAALAGACALLFQLAEGLPLFIALSVLYGAFWTSVLPLTESYLLKRDKAALQNYGGYARSVRWPSSSPRPWAACCSVVSASNWCPPWSA